MFFRTTLTAVLSIVLFTTAFGQIKYGFKTGLNFASFRGPSETDVAGTNLENWQNVTGFHIGACFNYNFNDHLGLRAEVLFSKKGARYNYDGQAYRVFSYSGGSTMTTGTAVYRLNVTNSYIDVPLMLYGRVGDFELSAGAYAGFLLQSSGEGSYTYSGVTSGLQNPTGELKFLLDHNYRKDAPGGADNSEVVAAQVDARTLELPRLLGAYYDLTEDKGPLYESLDYGVTAGVAYYLSRSIYAQVRLQYGLADLTNNDADLAKATAGDQGQQLFRDDHDRNYTIQVSVGFNF